MRHPVIAMSLWILVIVPSIAMGQDIPRLRGASWVIWDYLGHRHLISGVAVDVLVCGDGIPEEWQSQVARWIASRTPGEGVRSIALRGNCAEENFSPDTLYVNSIRIILDSAKGELKATMRRTDGFGASQSEYYVGMPTMTEYLTFAVDVGGDLSAAFGMTKVERAIPYDPLRYYLASRRRLVTYGVHPWIVVCDESVPVSVVNDYVIGDNGRPGQFIMTYDPTCQVPIEVQRDTELSALLIRKVEQVDGRVVVEATRVSASKRYPHAWGERFELLSDGRASLRLGRFAVVSPD